MSLLNRLFPGLLEATTILHEVVDFLGRREAEIVRWGHANTLGEFATEGPRHRCKHRKTRISGRGRSRRRWYCCPAPGDSAASMPGSERTAAHWARKCRPRHRR